MSITITKEEYVRLLGEEYKHCTVNIKEYIKLISQPAGSPTKSINWDSHAGYSERVATLMKRQVELSKLLRENGSDYMWHNPLWFFMNLAETMKGREFCILKYIPDEDEDSDMEAGEAN